MENDGEAGELLFDLMEHVECEWGRNELAGLGIAGALLGLELVSAVAGADGDGEGIATGAGGEVDHFFRTGVVGFLGGNLIFHTGQDAEFGFDGHVMGVSICDDFAGQGDVFLEGFGASV